MSKENVDVARRACAAFLARDFDEWVGYHHPEVEFETLVSEVEGPYRGHEGLRQWAAGLLAAFPDWTMSIVEIRGLGSRVLIHISTSGEGAGSGAGMREDRWGVLEFRCGRVVWFAVFRSEAEALEAARLRG